MPCPACGQNDHKRASSRKCPEHSPRQNKRPPEENTYKTDEHVFKVGFKSILRPRFHRYMIPLIENVVRNNSQIAFEAAQLLDLHLTLLIEKGAKIPDIYNETYVKQFFRIMQRCRMNHMDADIMETFAQQYQNCRVDTYESPVHCTQVISYIVKEYCVNIRTHIPRIVDILFKKFLKHIFISKWGVNNKDTTSLVSHIMETDDQKQQEFRVDNPHLARYWELYESLCSDTGEALKWIYQQNISNMRRGEKVYPLVPNYNISAKYITLDTDCLYRLLNGHYCFPVDQVTFGKEQSKWFKHFFKIPKRFMTPGIDKTVFNFMIKTDGVGASVVLARWKKKVKKTEYDGDKKAYAKMMQEKKKLERERDHDRLRSILIQEGSIYIGVDPGKKDVMTSIVEGERVGKHWSNDRYYTESKFRVRRVKATRYIQESGLHTYNNGMPAYASGLYSSFKMRYLAHVLGSVDFTHLFDLKCSHRYKKLRWSSYMHNQKTVRKFCEELIADNDRSKTVICFGDASFSHNLKGTATSPKQERFKKCFRLIGCNVYDTPEYNSSQVCTNCLKPQRLEPGCKSKKVIEKHFVRSCIEKTCQTIWNRDVNAALNMIKIGKGLILEGSKPEVFSHQLPKRSKQPVVKQNPVVGCKVTVCQEVSIDGE